MSNDTLQRDERARLYSYRYARQIEYRNKLWALMTDEFFSKFVDPGFTILDLGCGYCEFINNIKCKEKWAIDLNPTAIKMAAPDVKLIQQDCSHDWPIEDQTLDFIFTSNFLEHLPDKLSLEKTLTQAYKALKPDGRLLAIGPNIKFLPGRYWDFWDHHLPLSESSLAEVLQTHGFTVESSFPKFLPYTMVNTPRYPLIFISLYLKFKILWELFGKQFLVIARKAAI